ncbi:hypothetical protein GCM10010233_53340 [Streptomyces pseudogriseolus]|uniref:Uncharacterized protein n=1 Tax=Streptomyces pseudogriseolus TaxID=36817 RepID=A0ABQ2TBJ0_STREZ|nr:hypothetical protein GCM10010233_53340 [Streptomyces gancidicus]GGS61367.1 hypothetical protein GCM10010285_45930 [Streptomyces rubiginosus]
MTLRCQWDHHLPLPTPFRGTTAAQTARWLRGARRVAAPPAVPCRTRRFTPAPEPRGPHRTSGAGRHVSSGVRRRLPSGAGPYAPGTGPPAAGYCGSGGNGFPAIALAF